MKLRTWLAITLVGVSVPLVAGAHRLRVVVEEQAAISSLASLARARMEDGGRTECEAAPTTFRDPRSRPDHKPPDHDFHDPNRPPSGEGRPPPPPWGDRETSRPPPPRGPKTDLGPGPPGRYAMFAYRPELVSDNPDAPAFPPTLRTDLEGGERETGEVKDSNGRRTVTAAVRMNWSVGPCAIVLAFRDGEIPPANSFSDLRYAALITAALVLTVFLAILPVERRVRRLAADVRRSAANHYRGVVGVEARDEIGELASAFNAASSEVRVHIEELERRERMLRDFVQNTTHDVMLPLTVLQGHLTIMREALEDGMSPDRQSVREALEESHYLASLVLNLGAAAKLETGRPELRRDVFSWNQVVERVMQRHAPIAREKGVELAHAAPESEVRAEGDVTLIEQALSNVVHNAVRYNKAGGHVAVILEHDEGRFAVRVFDDGPGVAPEELTRISDRSYRSDAARVRYPGGLGLGLAIAREVAERHGFALALRQSESGGLEVELSGPTLLN